MILDKNAHIRTVVNKLDTIDHEFRFFKMEVLAGDDDLDVEVVRFAARARLNGQVEHGVRYRFNFAEVYWNTRLSTEHLRLVDIFQPDELIVDAFAGVGPFALPAARKGCFVLASDLNPASARSLAANVQLNKVRRRCLSVLMSQLGARIRTGNADGRAWIREATLEAWQRPFVRPPPKPAPKRDQPAPVVAAPSLPPPRLVAHFVMNLPASALSFLDAYRGIYRPLLELPDFDVDAARRSRPMVHCYCFSRCTTPEEATPDICKVRELLCLVLTISARECGARARCRARDGRSLQHLPRSHGRAQVGDVQAVFCAALGSSHCIRLTWRRDRSGLRRLPSKLLLHELCLRASVNEPCLASIASPWRSLRRASRDPRRSRATRPCAALCAPCRLRPASAYALSAR